MGQIMEQLSFRMIEMNYQLVIDERMALGSLIHDNQGDVCMDLLVQKHCVRSHKHTYDGIDYLTWSL
jgi:hypothetical protein